MPIPSTTTAPTQAQLADAKQKVKASLNAVLAIAEAIRALGTVPTRDFYTQIMGHMNLETFTSFVNTLKGAQLVSESNHVLTWIGPKLDDGTAPS
jgi:hypothetical protein